MTGSTNSQKKLPGEFFFKIARFVILTGFLMGIGAEAVAGGLTAPTASAYTVTLSWTAPGDDGQFGRAAEYDVRCATFSIFEGNWTVATPVANPPEPQAAGSLETFTVDDLYPSTTYYFAIRVADESGNWSSISNVVVATTAADVTPPDPADDIDAETGAENGEIIIRWTAPADDIPGGRVAQYLIGYADQEINEFNWNTALSWPSPPMPSVPGATDSCLLSGLVPGTMYWLAVVAIDAAGNISLLSNVDSAAAKFSIIAGMDDDDGGELPATCVLGQNYPNPFNPTTAIPFSLPRSSSVNLTVYNVAGQAIATLIDESLPSGDHVIQWDGTTDGGSSVASGVYFYHLASGDFRESKRMVLVK